ncbi:MAG TPA: hypothetical protein VIX90_15415, partial [Edaphobacter sp.]
AAKIRMTDSLNNRTAAKTKRVHKAQLRVVFDTNVLYQAAEKLPDTVCCLPFFIASGVRTSRFLIFSGLSA